MAEKQVYVDINHSINDINGIVTKTGFACSSNFINTWLYVTLMGDHVSPGVLDTTDLLTA
jgi:hypothetical protein